MEPEEVAEAFRLLKQEGKVLHFGVSNMNRSQIELLESALDEPVWCDQMQMSLVHTPMLDAGFHVDMVDEASILHSDGILEYLHRTDKILQVWSPLQKGSIGGAFLNMEQYQDLLDAMMEVAESRHVSRDAIAYAWLLRLPQKVQIVAGTTKLAHLRPAVEASETELSRAEWYRLYRAAGNILP